VTTSKEITPGKGVGGARWYPPLEETLLHVHLLPFYYIISTIFPTNLKISLHVTKECLYNNVQFIFECFSW